METGIKGIILDVDGVIIGEKVGFNSPWPNQAVIDALKTIKKNIPICLITAKPYFSIEKIIRDATLNNPHVTDGGSVIIDPIDNIIVKKHIIETNLAQEALNMLIKNKVYTEFYTTSNYYIQENLSSDIAKKHAYVLQKEPIIVDNYSNEVEKLEITKIMAVADDKEDIKKIEIIFKPFAEKLNLYWAVHPAILPLQFGVIVPLGISKTEGIKEMTTSLGLSFENMLGIGDSTSDWQFIELCKYGGAMGNASQELKNKVLSKGNEYSFIGPTVDENGILDILKHFGLLS